MSFANSYLAYLRSHGSQSTSPDDLKPFSVLANDNTSPATSLAIALMRGDELAGLLATGSDGHVKLGHHFLFDMRTPFQPDAMDQFIMLTGCSTIDNPIAINPSVAFAMQPMIRCPTWDQLAAAPDGPVIKAISAPRTGCKRDHGLRSFLPIPAWLAAALMAANTEDAASLCVTAIQAIHAFDTRVVGELFTDASDTNSNKAQHDNDDDDDDENAAPPESAQQILEWVPMFLWAVAAKVITGCTYQLVNSAPVECWCTSV
jgi:hypothetical protein